MCEYSLAHFPNRLAVEGEHLILRRFPCGTLGLASVRRSLKEILFPSTTCAVCVAPGARLLLRDIPEAQRRRLEIGPIETVTFVQQSAEAFNYRDAVQFSNGRQVLLQRLEPGQRLRVLSLHSVEDGTLPTSSGPLEYVGKRARTERRSDETSVTSSNRRRSLSERPLAAWVVRRGGFGNS